MTHVLHMFDSQSNRDIYTSLTASTWRPLQSISELEELALHAAIESRLSYMPWKWQLAILALLNAAFPEYSARDYSLTECMHMEILQAAWCAEQHIQRCLHAVDHHSGKQALTRAYIRQGLKAVALDRKYDENLEFSKPSGTRAALFSIRYLLPEGMAWIASACTSWIWIGRRQTHRSRTNITGRSDSATVLCANTCKDLTVLIMAICNLSKRSCMVEQPLSGLMALDLSFAGALRLCGGSTITLDHGVF